LVEAELVNGLKKLIGNARDGDVRDLELLLPQKVEQQIQRTGERLQLHHERRTCTQRYGGRLGLAHDLKVFHQRPTL